MRKILLSLVFTAWMGLAWAATPKRVVLQVENMTCPACSITIEKALDRGSADIRVKMTRRI